MGVGKKEEIQLKMVAEGERYLYYLEYKSDIGILKILAKLELIDSFDLLSLFLSDYKVRSLIRDLEICWQCGAAFLTNLKVPMYKGFYWEMRKISKVEECQQGRIDPPAQHSINGAPLDLIKNISWL